jgi:hypothetical protein
MLLRIKGQLCCMNYISIDVQYIYVEALLVAIFY